MANHTAQIMPYADNATSNIYIIRSFMIRIEFNQREKNRQKGTTLDR